MFYRVPRLTPGYIRLLQTMEECKPVTAGCIVNGNGNRTQAYHNVSVTPPAERSMPGMAMLLGAVGIGMCGYSSRQLALYHRPSARVLQWVGTHTDASMVGAAAQRTPFMDVNRRVGGCQEIPPLSFVGQKVPVK